MQQKKQFILISYTLRGDSYKFSNAEYKSKNRIFVSHKVFKRTCKKSHFCSIFRLFIMVKKCLQYF